MITLTHVHLVVEEDCWHGDETVVGIYEELSYAKNIVNMVQFPSKRRIVSVPVGGLLKKKKRMLEACRSEH